MSTPTFWLGILFIILFSVKLGWFPVALSVPIGVLSENVGFAERMQHIILPALTLSIISISSICMNTRQKVIEIMESDYILFAKARGESQISIIFNHVLKNVSLPAITLQFLSFSELFGGTIFVEQVFSYPGLGQATVSAGLKGDLPLLIIDNSYTRNYLEEFDNKKESIFKYLNLDMSDDVFDRLVNKYNLEASNYLVDLLYEAIIKEI